MRSLICKLASLLGDKYIRDEIRIYRLAHRRLKSRFRNNLFVSRLNQIVLLNKKLQTEFKPELFNTRTHRPLFGQSITNLIKFLDQIIDLALKVYCQTQAHIRVGHLTHHLIVIRASLSRLRVYYKAILIYACDIHMEMNNDELSFCVNDIIRLMKKHYCKPKIKSKPPAEATNSEESIYQDVGPVIDRKTMRPVSQRAKN